jgi:hypothetical protein
MEAKCRHEAADDPSLALRATTSAAGRGNAGTSERDAAACWAGGAIQAAARLSEPKSSISSGDWRGIHREEQMPAVRNIRTIGTQVARAMIASGQAVYISSRCGHGAWPQTNGGIHTRGNASAVVRTGSGFTASTSYPSCCPRCPSYAASICCAGARPRPATATCCSNWQMLLRRPQDAVPTGRRI